LPRAGGCAVWAGTADSSASGARQATFAAHEIFARDLFIVRKPNVLRKQTIH
jgi:hypothetical protein